MEKAISETEWLEVLGRSDGELNQKIVSALQAKLNSGVYHADEMERIRRLDTSLVDDEIGMDDVALGKLRRLCQIWDVDIRITHISSHRPLIGPVIVFCKKLFLPVLRFMLKDSLRQQRDFNATAITLLAELMAKRPNSQG